MGMDSQEIRERLARSRFRSRFRLDEKDWAYIQTKNLETIKRHAGEFVLKRLAPAYLEKDGKQTPFKGHPVFKAQHATATCCRGCLEKWYKIPKGRSLTTGEIHGIVAVIIAWIRERSNL